MPDAAQTISRNKPAAKPAVWTVARVEGLLSAPFADLIFEAQQIHRLHFAANEVQLSTLLSIKTGGGVPRIAVIARRPRVITPALKTRR